MLVRLKAFVLSPVLIIGLVSVVALSGAVYVYNYQKSDAVAFQLTHTRQDFFRSDPPVVSASPVLMPVTLEQISNAEYTYGSTTFRLKNGSIVRPNLTSTGGGQEAYTILPQSFATGNLVGSRKYSAVVVNHGFGANRQIPILFVFSMGAQQPNQDSSIELTEHLQVDRSSIADHLLTLNVTEVGPNENYHAPTLKQTLTYELRGAMLVAADNTASESLSQNGISVRFPANWSVNRQDANSFSLISDGYKKKLADGPVKSNTEAPTADIDVLVVKSTTDTTLMQSAVAGGLTSNIATITVNGHAAVAGMRDGFSSSYVIYVQNGVNLYVIDFALREMATQLSVEERTILDSVTFQ